jgi:hypothetical protein
MCSPEQLMGIAVIKSAVCFKPLQAAGVIYAEQQLPGTTIQSSDLVTLSIRKQYERIYHQRP